MTSRKCPTKRSSSSTATPNGRPGRPYSFLLFLLLAAFVITSMPGCSGCRQRMTAAKKKKTQKEKEDEILKQKKKPKPNFEFKRTRTQPSDDSNSLSVVKPGHWTSAVQPMIANNFTHQAELESASVDQRGQPLDIEHTPHHMTMSRPASLPKGQLKQFELSYFVPRRTGRESQKVWLQTRLRSRGGGRVDAEAQQPTTAILDHQYLFLVLSANSDRYGYLKRMHSIAPPVKSDVDASEYIFYRVMLPKIDQIAPIPSNSLTWTSTAYVLWDGLDPSFLTPDQRQAMIDWLHWGGQIIVSGPNSLDQLKGSFLSDYLPAKKIESISLQQSAFEELNQHWSLSAKGKKVGRRLEVLPDKPLLGVSLEKDPAANYLPNTGKLVLERRVGRGRVVLTAFSLTSPTVINWRNYDGFFNSCLLRRSSRHFSGDEFDELTVGWAGRLTTMNDPRMSTAVRYLTRDLGFMADDKEGLKARQILEQQIKRDEEILYRGGINPPNIYGYNNNLPAKPKIPAKPTEDNWRFNGYRSWPKSGIAGWNDFHGVSDAARRSLKEAAGITVPKSDFILRIMAVYLLVLVPVNWGFFRLIGRVEWAWVAAPVIAVCGAMAVIHYAQLNIGFARSRTEVGVLEIHADYPRAHFTRYTALYTSLSTSYDLQFEDPTALAMPFSPNPEFERLRSQSSNKVHFRRGRDNLLSGFQVDSNSTDMVHSEQMYSLGGTFQLSGDEDQGYRVVNNSEKLTVLDAGVLRKTLAGELEIAWVGELKPKTSMRALFVTKSEEQLYLEEWENSPTTSSTKQSGKLTEEIRLWRILRLFAQKLQLNKGEVRLIGWTNQDLGGLSIIPKPAQSKLHTVVLVHLKQGQLPQAIPDENTPGDVVDEKNRTATDPDLDLFKDIPDPTEPQP